jgi:hypothetical protein
MLHVLLALMLQQSTPCPGIGSWRCRTRLFMQRWSVDPREQWCDRFDEAIRGLEVR